MSIFLLKLIKRYSSIKCLSVFYAIFVSCLRKTLMQRIWPKHPAHKDIFPNSPNKLHNSVLRPIMGAVLQPRKTIKIARACSYYVKGWPFQNFERGKYKTIWQTCSNISAHPFLWPYGSILRTNAWRPTYEQFGWDKTEKVPTRGFFSRMSTSETRRSTATHKLLWFLFLDKRTMYKINAFLWSSK